jgi:hypothetical protein
VKKLLLVAVALPFVLVHDARAQSSVDTSPRSAVLGTWRGTSTCLVRPSACNDEVVVYRITPGASRDSVALDALKIVRGQEEDMGTLACQVTSATPPGADITCRMHNGVWKFRVQGDSLVGDLRLPDNTKFRDVRTKRGP